MWISYLCLGWRWSVDETHIALIPPVLTPHHSVNKHTPRIWKYYPEGSKFLVKIGPLLLFGFSFELTISLSGGHPAGVHDEREQRRLHRPLQRPGPGAGCDRTLDPAAVMKRGSTLLRRVCHAVPSSSLKRVAAPQVPKAIPTLFVKVQ